MKTLFSLFLAVCSASIVFAANKVSGSGSKPDSASHRWNYVFEFDFKTGKGEWYRYYDDMTHKRSPVQHILVYNRNMRIHISNINAGNFLLDIENKPNYYQYNSVTPDIFDKGNGASQNDIPSASSSEEIKKKLDITSRKMQNAKEKIAEAATKLSVATKSFNEGKSKLDSKIANLKRNATAANIDSVKNEIDRYVEIRESTRSALESQLNDITKQLQYASKSEEPDQNYQIAREKVLFQFNSVFKLMEDFQSAKWFDDQAGPRYIVLRRVQAILNLPEIYDASFNDTFYTKSSGSIDRTRVFRYRLESGFGVRELMVKALMNQLESLSDTAHSEADVLKLLAADDNIAELNNLSNNIAQAYRKFGLYSDEIWSDPIPVSDADEVFQNVSIKDVREHKIYSTITTPKIWVAGAVKFNISAGFGFNGLIENAFKFTDAASAIGSVKFDSVTMKNDTTFLARKSVVRTDRNKFEYGIVTLLHTYITTGLPINIALSAGVNITNQLNADFLIGGSVLFGRQERISLSSGLSVGRRKRLINGFQEGTVYDPKVYSDTDLTVDTWRYSWFASLTYNLIGKNNIFNKPKNN